jgi:hypothetical protein
VQTSASYTPRIGATLTILTAENWTGNFSHVTGKQLSGEHWRVIYSSSGITLKAVSG